MMKIETNKIIFSIIRPILSIILALSVGIYINLFTAEAITKKLNFSQVFLKMGWMNIFVIIWLLIIFLETRFTVRELNTIKRIRKNISNQFINLMETILLRVFKLCAKSIQFQDPKNRINLHFYTTHRKEGRTHLLKERNLCYDDEEEAMFMPKNVSFQRAIVEEDHVLVICKAFKKRSVYFEHLPKNHISMYPERLKNAVDPHIRWVLSSPFWKRERDVDPAGMLVMFSSKDFVKDSTKEAYLGQTLVMLSEIVELLINFQEKI